jgi:hypothetical protein
MACDSGYLQTQQCAAGTFPLESRQKFSPLTMSRSGDLLYLRGTAARDEKARIRIFSANGRLLANLEKMLKAGDFAIPISKAEMSSGLKVIMITTPSFHAAYRIVF